MVSKVTAISTECVISECTHIVRNLWYPQLLHNLKLKYGSNEKSNRNHPMNKIA